MSKKVLIISSDIENYEIAKRMAKVDRFDLVFADSIEDIEAEFSQSLDSIVAIHLDVNVGHIDLDDVASLLAPYALHIPLIIRTSRHGNFYEPLNKLLSLSYMVLHGNSAEELSQSFIKLDLYCGFLDTELQLLDWSSVRDGNDEFVLHAAAKASKSDLPILIEGVIGTPKKDMAFAIHKLSNRYRNPIKVVDAHRYTPDELVTVIFGGESSSGIIQDADRGTLFINNLNNFSAETQRRISEFLDNGRVYCAKNGCEIKLNVKLVIATDLDLINEVKTGALDEAFYYRLSVSPIVMNKFNTIAADMPKWVDDFIGSLGQKSGQKEIGIDASARDLLANYEWPGHHRQFFQVLAWVLSQPQNNIISRAGLPQFLDQAEGRLKNLSTAPNLAPDMADLQSAIPQDTDLVTKISPTSQTQYLNLFNEFGDLRSVAEIEEELIRRAIAYYDGKMSFVARQLGIGRSTLYRKLKEYQIDPDRPLEFAD
ncbi:MAG: sigma-54-dependent Fis family transcriptional regulator [Rhizobiaceae bacterium]|nr:sigma-54-dependent Fis family transcriptional regulator [Rhizobiaceae bacterium]